MYAVNDALADQIIRASATGGPAAAGRYLSPAHAGAIRSIPVGAPRERRVSPLAAIRALPSRIAALFTATQPAPAACCAVA